MIQRRTPIRRKTPLKRSAKPIRRVSLRRAKQLRQYSGLREDFLFLHAVCAVWLRENGWAEDPAAPRWYRTDEQRPGEPPTVKIVSAEGLIARYGAPAATEIHHKNKRRGARLNEQEHWLAVCRANHERIENDKAWARANGFLLNF